MHTRSESAAGQGTVVSTATATATESLLSAFARQLAAAATRHEAHATIARWLPGRGPAEPAEPAVRPRVDDDTTPDLIGIWRRTRSGEETWYVRDDSVSGADMWAEVERIGPKHGKRVVLIGESCARAWPLDPLFNCAVALETFLRSVPGGDTVEVVDLARNGMKPAWLIAIVQAALALEPDACVIFASNNFRVDTRELDLEALAADLTASQSWRSVAPHIERIMRRQLAAWMKELADILRARGVPAVFVMPAENMQDWQLPMELHNPLLTSRDQLTREELLAAIEPLAAREEWAAVDVRARELLALEDGCSIAALKWLGRCALARQANAEALSFFEQARDLAFLGVHAYVPRIDEIRARAAEHGFRLVDLARDMLAQLDGLPPGRLQFFDSCHMTASAVVESMAATAEQVLPLLQLPEVSRADLLEVPIAVGPYAHAQAHFISSVIQAQYEELSRYHVLHALGSTPEILDVFFAYAEFRLRPVPALLNEASHRLVQLRAKFPALKYYQGSSPYWHKGEIWIRVVGEIIARDHPGALDAWRAIVNRAYPLDERGIDLLEFARPGDFTQLGIVGAYMRCFRPRMLFSLDRHALPSPCRLRLTARARERGSIGQRASLFVNGTLAHTFPLQSNWSTEECTVTLAADDITELAIVWPDPGVSTGDRVARVAEAFESWTMAAQTTEASELGSRMYAIWGEIHAFTASAAV
jgi:hypothetical protein